MEHEGLVHRCITLPFFKPTTHLHPGGGFALHTQDDAIRLEFVLAGTVSMTLPNTLVVSVCSLWLRKKSGALRVHKPVSCIACAAFGGKELHHEDFELQWIPSRRR